jgi:hypothetical protein
VDPELAEDLLRLVEEGLRGVRPAQATMGVSAVLEGDRMLVTEPTLDAKMDRVGEELLGGLGIALLDLQRGLEAENARALVVIVGLLRNAERFGKCLGGLVEVAKHVVSFAYATLGFAHEIAVGSGLHPDIERFREGPQGLLGLLEVEVAIGEVLMGNALNSRHAPGGTANRAVQSPGSMSSEAKVPQRPCSTCLLTKLCQR